MNCAEQIRANNPVLDGWVRASSLERDMLIREHDRRVEEYIELEKMLPVGFERDAMQRGVEALADAGLTLVAARLQHYLLRLEAAAR